MLPTGERYDHPNTHERGSLTVSMTPPNGSEDVVTTETHDCPCGLNALGEERPDDTDDAGAHD